MTPKIEQAIHEAVVEYNKTYESQIKAMDDLIAQVIDTGESFRIFWCAEILRVRLARISDHLLTLKAKWEARN